MVALVLISRPAVAELKFADNNKAEGYDLFGTGKQNLVCAWRVSAKFDSGSNRDSPIFPAHCVGDIFLARSLLGDWYAVLALFPADNPAYDSWVLLAGVCRSLVAGVFAGGPVRMDPWLESPGWGRSVILGTAVAGTLLSNTPWMVYLPPCAAAILACRWWAWRSESKISLPGECRAALQRWTRPSLVALLTLCFVVWGGYRFSVRPLNQVFEHPLQSAQHLHLPSPLKAVAVKVAELNPRLPAAEFLRAFTRRLGKTASFIRRTCSESARGGWWYFYFFIAGL